MKLHALDLSSSVGSAIMERGRVPLFQTLRLDGDRAHMMGRFMVWLDEMHMVHAFDAIAWERPIITPKDKVDKLEILYGLVGVAYAFAGKHKLPYCEVTIQEAKFALTGRGNADKADMVAAAMIDCSGVEVEYIEDVDYFALCVAALDAMPGGREAVVRAVVREWGYIPKDGEGEG